MNKAQMKLKDVFSIIRRRKWFLIIPPVIVTIISGAGAFMLPRMYESSIKILVQKTEVQNPLTSLANAMTMRDDDPLRSFDEIIYSYRTLSQLMDSLGFSKNISEVERRTLMVKVKNSIQTSTQARESFSITYFSNDPIQAQRGASVLADIFIQTRGNSKNQKNELTVAFYQKKLDEFQGKLDATRGQMISLLRQRAQGTPGVNNFLYTRIDQLEQEMRETEGKIKDFQNNLKLLRSLSSEISTPMGRQLLFELQRSDVPYAIELRSLLSSYDDVSAKYTPQHPEVVKVESKITELLERMRVALGTEISKQESELKEKQLARAQAMEEIMNSSVIQQEDRDKESNYAIYQRLYDEMKMKLEEAQMSLAIGQDSEGQYTIMDPALVPLFPSKPSRILIIFGGFAVGIVLGILSVMGAELLDTTIRTPSEILVYRKPILAMLPEGLNKKAS
jgi:polysaccharide biosynthesis transport protein